MFLTRPCFREEAYSMMSKSPFFGTWDPDAFRSYIDYALVEDSSGGVSLKCNKIQVREHATGAQQLRLLKLDTGSGGVRRPAPQCRGVVGSARN
jgi:hypothetical protein